MALLIDTDLLIDLVRGAGTPAVEELLGDEDRAISVITVSELLRGVLRATGARRTRCRAFAEHVLAGLRATAAAVVRHGVLDLTFADGVRGEVEVLDRMHGPVFDEARTPEGFAKVTVDAETGTVVWPGGADLAPDTLYERVRTGVWPSTTLPVERAATS